MISPAQTCATSRWSSGRRHCRRATPPPRSGSSSTRAAAWFSFRPAKRPPQDLPGWAGAKNRRPTRSRSRLAAGTRIRGPWQTRTRDCSCPSTNSPRCNGNGCLAKRPCSQRSTTARHCSRVRRLAKGRFIFAPPCPCSRGRSWAAAWWSCQCSSGCSPPAAPGCSATPWPNAARSAPATCSSSGPRWKPASAATCRLRPVFTSPATVGWSSTGRLRKMNLNAWRTRSSPHCSADCRFSSFRPSAMTPRCRARSGACSCFSCCSRCSSRHG